MRAIQVTRFGGPEVLVPTELDPPVAGPGRLRVEVSAAGVNFADTHRTDGSYRGGVALPFVPGVEIVGRTETGRRILSPILETCGGYAEYAVAPASSARSSAPSTRWSTPAAHTRICSPADPPAS